MIFSGYPFYAEAVAKKFAHEPLDPYVIYGVQVFSVEDTQKWLVVRDDSEIGAS